MTEKHIDESTVREAAYFIWLNEGQPAGQEHAHWMRAVEMLKTSQPKAKKPAKKASAAATRKPAAASKKPAAKKAAAKRKTKT
ncbi:DUF2934 domain-containing protein [Roseobacter denitrificans]|uniref:DUF2934 domain-containing protein n=1 Tax=Roseobacter denitrificans (strain ATCC 33942 / OCh 114) TaxID=375451 RepID=Q16A80_ROSDO|nr:DUF2934 domain-containing protein [Roseobacter denitrificans]ABG31113.1 hypothetical protein RD1_1480 [Roseobacter denitrificans OCh 114]AVL54184.1 DUF2934 domain-containing protein [Roseobacter denitrificans]SFG32688.1 Protein of unknown function [Roseobacter denitrificans OCh 114]